MKEDLPRTSNCVESWHNGWAIVVGVSHGSTGRIVREIQLEQKTAAGRVQAILAGAQGEVQNDVKDKNADLKRIVMKFSDYKLADFIDTITNVL